MNMKRLVAATALGVVFVPIGSAGASTVWNVNINGSIAGGTYQGAAPENNGSQIWNNVNSDGITALVNGEGDGGAGVSITITPTGGSSIGFGGANVAGDDIFDSWMKDGNADGVVNDDLFIVSFGNLNPAYTYGLVVYSDWFWKNGNGGQEITQTVGTGLASSFFLNRYVGGEIANGSVGPLLEDTDPLNANPPSSAPTNYTRFDGLSPSGGELAFTMGAVNGPINGFQLIEVVPEPSSLALLGLGGLLIARRRR